MSSQPDLPLPVPPEPAALGELPETPTSRLGLGMCSLVLGTVGLLLSFLPVLGLPISVFGLFFGILGLIAALFFGGDTLRWSAAGILLSSTALVANVALTYAPSGYLPGREVPKSWQSPPSRVYIPPPAKP
jgi:hypothetical protein